jgi:hypothetical protein
MNRRVSRLCVTLGVVALMSGAGATTASGYGLTSGGEGVPGPGICVPPGTYVSDAAKRPGPARLMDQPPGQVVSAVCAPGRQPDQ